MLLWELDFWMHIARLRQVIFPRERLKLIYTCRPTKAMNTRSSFSVEIMTRCWQFSRHKTVSLRLLETILERAKMWRRPQTEEVTIP